MPDGMIQCDLDQSALEATKVALRGIPGAVGKAVAMAANETAKKLKTQISTDIRQKVPIKKGDIDKFINIYRANAGDQSPQATVRLSKSARIPLSYFGAREVGVTRGRSLVKKHGGGHEPTGGGVSYNIGHRFVEGAFIVERFGGHVFKRVGKERLPIQKLYGPSPWGVFVKAGLMGKTLIDAKTEMEAQLFRAARYILYRNGMLAAA